MRQRWFYAEQPNNTNCNFVLLVDHRGSSSCRIYHPETGAKEDEKPTQRRPSQEAFADFIKNSKALEGLPNARVTKLTYGLNAAELNALRLQAGLPPVKHRNVFRNREPGAGILDGCDAIVDQALGLSVSHRSRTAALELSEGPREIHGLALVERFYNRIEQNWDRSNCRSTELWRWKALGYISEQNTSIEKGLEKSIINATHNWVNQIPAASGLLRNREQRHSNVDLGHEVSKGHFELIELKAGQNADNPVRAAFEIVSYGLLYCFARLHLPELQLRTVSSLLLAHAVDLKVLGPRDIYLGYELGWLEVSLDEAVRSFAVNKVPGLTLRFMYESFPPEFDWPECSDSDLRSWLERRERVYQ